jgi:hypothetical protein
MLKQLCFEEYQYERFVQKMHEGSSKSLESASSKSLEVVQFGKILKELGGIKSIEGEQVGQFDQFLAKAAHSISGFQKRLGDYCAEKAAFSEFEVYSIGNLMQAAPLLITTQPNLQEFMAKELSSRGKLFRVVHIAMAHFTVATELRLISASKYALDENQRKLSQEFKESKIYHLMALVLLGRYLPCKSVFFDHSVNSFRNHYGIDLLEMV